MILLACSVFDAKVGAFTNPMYFRSRGEAIRSFSTAVRDEKSQFALFKADYALVYLGDWDDGSGAFTSLAPTRLIGADEV